METPFSCTTTTLADGHVVTVAGELDIATAPQLTEALKQFANGTVRVDVTAVTFLDSSGLHALVDAHRDITQGGGRMIICGPFAPIVDRLLEITRLDGYFEIEDLRATG